MRFLLIFMAIIIVLAVGTGAFFAFKGLNGYFSDLFGINNQFLLTVFSMTGIYCCYHLFKLLKHKTFRIIFAFTVVSTYLVSIFRIDLWQLIVDNKPQTVVIGLYLLASTIWYFADKFYKEVVKGKQC